MRPNYVKLRECDTIVTMNVDEMSAMIDFACIRDLYLTPMEALIYSVLRKYAGENESGRKFLKIAENDFLRVFRHIDGSNTIIGQSIAGLITKRLIVEAEDINQLFETNDLGEMYHLYHCL